VLASLLPSDFSREIFERLLGFGVPGPKIVEMRRIMDSGIRMGGFGFPRSFKANIREEDFQKLAVAVSETWGGEVTVIDPMSGGGAIPFESARMGFKTIANEYNPVACLILESILEYPYTHGPELADKVEKWGKILRANAIKRLERFFPKTIMGGMDRPHGYLFARTVPCPDTLIHTPLVSDWHLIKKKGSDSQTVAEPLVDRDKGTWKIAVKQVGKSAGQLRQAPIPTYSNGKGISLFSGQYNNGVWHGRQIPADYIRAKAQAGEMGVSLYAITVKTNNGLKFFSPEPAEQIAIDSACKELERNYSRWEKEFIIPNETIPAGDKTDEIIARGVNRWAEMFSPRQLLCFGVFVEELRALKNEIAKVEPEATANAITHLLSFALDKSINYNSLLSTWHASHSIIRSVFDQHNFSFKSTFVELAFCSDGMGLDWAIDSVVYDYRELSTLPKSPKASTVSISQGSASSMPHVADKSITAVVVDPPYADNVQYSELADFFYVWLKRTQGYRHPEWFSTYLCDHDQEAVVNLSRHRDEGGAAPKKGKRDGSAADAKVIANAFYQKLMTDVFRESRRILRDDGVLTVMFTHKKQDAWEALFSSLIHAGFTMTATWPIKTESEHSLHQAKKNAAQSTVILVARKRPEGAGIGYFDQGMRQELREKARATAERLEGEGLNPVDQLVGSFGPAMEVYSRFSEVRTDTGLPVGVDKAIDEAADAVSEWRVQKLSQRGLDGVEAEGKFALLCWDVLGAVEFRFNEAKLLGNAVGMDVDQLVAAGLVTKTGDKVNILSATDRRRDKALEPDSVEVQTLFGPTLTSTKKRVSKANILKVHPNDPVFRTALDACHALALRYTEAGGGAGGIGSARSLVNHHRWTKDSKEARLMEALVKAAPEAVRHEAGKKSVAAQYPEFRAWHALLKPLFGIDPPDWTPKKIPTVGLLFPNPPEDDEDESSDEGEE
jgi:adenine-specific DNA methylase